MNDAKFGLLIVLGAFLAVALLGGGLTVGRQALHLWLQPQVVVQVDGQEVFRGSNACVEEVSLGSATSVQIGRGWLCLLPGPKFTSKNVKVIPQ